MQLINFFKQYNKFIFAFLGILVIGILGYTIITKSKKTTTKAADPKEVVSEADQKVEIKKEFEFKIQTINDQGQFLTKQGKIKFIITEAELKKEIKLKGDAKNAADGQKYLILRLELQNDSSDRLAIISNKYIRLIGSDNKKFSPDFHNAMVAVDPLSVRRDLVSYIVNENSKNFKFQVGELDSDKQTIEIAF